MIKANKIVKPKIRFDFNDSPIIPLSKTKKWSDEAMRMRLEQGEALFSQYRIQGVNSKGELVGKDEQVLPDGWYQFVVMGDLENGQPVLRYYACGETHDNTSFLKQDTKQVKKTELIYNKNRIKIQRPATHKLSYAKYVAHSQLAGGHAVRAAGVFMIKGGKLRVIDDSSGHYALPETKDDSKFAVLLTAERVFKHFGVNTSKTVLERWKPYYGIDKLAKKLAATLFQPFIPSSLSRTYKIEATLAENRQTEPGRKNPAQILFESSKP